MLHHVIATFEVDFYIVTFLLRRFFLLFVNIVSLFYKYLSFIKRHLKCEILFVFNFKRGAWSDSLDRHFSIQSLPHGPFRQTWKYNREVSVRSDILRLYIHVVCLIHPNDLLAQTQTRLRLLYWLGYTMVLSVRSVALCETPWVRSSDVTKQSMGERTHSDTAIFPLESTLNWNLKLKIFGVNR